MKPSIDLETQIAEETMNFVESLQQGWEILRRQLKHWTWLFKSPLLAALIAGTIVYAFLKVFHHREPAARTLKSDS